MSDSARPVPRANSNANTTPSQHVNTDLSISVYAKRRVDRATEPLTKKCCLIENTAESNHVEYAHCLARSTNNSVLDRLEVAWKMKWSTLNVDTRYNIFRLSSKFHKAFDAGKWLLLPETSIIDKYYDASKTGDFPDINDQVYKYKLIASPHMREIPIHRLNITHPQPPFQPSASDFSYFPHPYHEFPIINSHVHPRFVICNSGLKLQKDLTPWQGDSGDLNRDISKTHAIWQSWTEELPPGTIPENLSDDDDPSIKEDDSVQTGRRNPVRSTRTKRKTREEQSSPTPMSSKQQRLSKDGPWLDDETLHEFDQQTMASDKHTDMKVTDWLSGVSQLETKVGVVEKLNDVTDSDVAMNLGGEDTHMFIAGV